MAWTLEGRAIEHCNCDSVCPCFTSALGQQADYERCRGFIAVHVDDAGGDAAGLDGLTGIIVIDSPPMMADGNWTVGVVVDEQASDEQADLLAAILTGEAGGPMEAFGPLIGTRAGIERAEIDFVSDGNDHSVRAGSAIDAEFADMVHEGAEQPVQLIGAALPFGPPVTISPPTKSLITVFGLDIDNSGRHGTTSKVDWAG